ncbi:GntR family transcriptional regulator [Pigmentiphaga soli]|uniref:GntR family transcriptional regulator n=1 Tax=Pigmentiphaga soli TaxID=1007095 RepID=A0ABP8HEH9_9BURK
MSPKLFSRSPQPLYLQAAAIFRANIHNRHWLPGQRIPPLESLMETYGISRATLRQALGLLEADALIHRSRGAGTFVSKALPARPTLLIPKTWAETVELSNQLGTVSLVQSDADVPLPEVLGMECRARRDGRFQFLCRVHTTEAGPFCYSEVYVDSGLFRKHRARMQKETVAPVLDQYYGSQLTQAHQVLNIIQAGKESAEALQIPVSSPVAEIRRFACLEDRVIYYARLEFPFHNMSMQFDLLGERKCGK